MFHHDIDPPLKAWSRGNSLFCAEGYLWPDWVAIMLTDEGVRRWDRVFDSGLSMEVEGQPGIVPQGRRVMCLGRYHLIPVEYLSQMDPAWVKRVRRTPAFRELPHVPSTVPLAFGSVSIVPDRVYTLTEVRLNVTEVWLAEDGELVPVWVPGWPDLIHDAMRDPIGYAIWQHSYDPSPEHVAELADHIAAVEDGVLAKFEEARR